MIQQETAEDTLDNVEFGLSKKLTDSDGILRIDFDRKNGESEVLNCTV